MNRRGVYQLELVAAMTLIAGVCFALLLAFFGMNRQVPDSGWKQAVSVPGGVSSKSKASSPSIHYVGIAAGGCAAANCHGGVRSLDDNGEPKAGNEWKTSAFDFLQHDPHAQAYNVLFEERSRIMIDRLARGDEALATGKIPFPGDRKDVLWYAGQLEKRCVSCHSTPLPATASNTTRGTLNDYALGVTCEACHGPASRWGDEHLSAHWQTNSHERIDNAIDKKSTGFNELEDLSVAAATCAKCHIGNGEQIDGKSYREVTHDLIAAGHPRLDFDFVAWYASMPAHWNREREQRAGFNTDAWLNGQIESMACFDKSIVDFDFNADDSTALGTTDTQQTATVDLAKFDCFACHRALRFPPSVPSPTSSSSTLPIPFGGTWSVFQTLKATPKGAEMDREIAPRELAHYLGTISSLGSYDELLSWYYAADAVSRDAEFAARSSNGLVASAKTLAVVLSQLKTAMEQYLASSGDVSRYSSPRGFVAPQIDDSDQPMAQQVQTAVHNARTALQELANAWSQ
jgi:hypothetical protein